MILGMTLDMYNQESNVSCTLYEEDKRSGILREDLYLYSLPLCI